MLSIQRSDDLPPTPQRSGRPRLLPVPPRHALDDPAAPFADLLAHFRQRAQLSQSDLGRLADVNASYINRLESGERRVPTPAVADALARALQLAPEETYRLLWSTGSLPPSLRRLGSADATILTVARLLSNECLSPEARADFRACIEPMAHHWRGSGR